MRWVEHVARVGQERKVYKLFFGGKALRKETIWKNKA
jgi:hypothetical protein